MLIIFASYIRRIQEKKCTANKVKHFPPTLPLSRQGSRKRSGLIVTLVLFRIKIYKSFDIRQVCWKHTHNWYRHPMGREKSVTVTSLSFEKRSLWSRRLSVDERVSGEFDMAEEGAFSLQTRRVEHHIIV